MNYLLVLQFSGGSLEDYDGLIALENDLIEELAGTAKVDGHDFGSGEMNIFIHTNDPKRTFETIKPMLTKRELLAHLVAASRLTTGEDYTVFWPIGSDKLFNIT